MHQIIINLKESIASQLDRTLEDLQRKLQDHIATLFVPNTPPNSMQMPRNGCH